MAKHKSKKSPVPSSKDSLKKPLSENHSEDISDIFSAIKRQHKKENAPSGENQSESLLRAGERTGTSAAGRKEGGPKAHKPTTATTSRTKNPHHASKETAATAKPKRDGLYRAPEKTVEISDSEFFVRGKYAEPDGQGSFVSSSLDDDLSKKEGVNRIVSLDELQTMISRNPRAGTTPNCPFDCDCCF